MANTDQAISDIAFVEVYTPMAKLMAYWHTRALGFKLVASFTSPEGKPGIASYVVKSCRICLVFTSAYPDGVQGADSEVWSFITKNYCGVKRIALYVSSVTDVFNNSVAKGAFPAKLPVVLQDEFGIVEEAAIKLYDNSEIMFINTSAYRGAFKPGYSVCEFGKESDNFLLQSIDHIAGEVRVNEMDFWTDYLSSVIGTSLVQSIKSSEDNKTGMLLNINQSAGKEITLVIAQPENVFLKSKVQQNIERFGPGIHHLAFATNNIFETIKRFSENGVEFVGFPASYYTLLRESKEFGDLDIDNLEKLGILVDKENDAYLFQKFIKPLSDRPFFLYEIVQRVNGYDGFALKNINVLKKAEEIEIMK